MVLENFLWRNLSIWAWTNVLENIGEDKTSSLQIFTKVKVERDPLTKLRNVRTLLLCTWSIRASSRWRSSLNVICPAAAFAFQIQYQLSFPSVIIMKIKIESTEVIFSKQKVNEKCLKNSFENSRQIDLSSASVTGNALRFHGKITF